MNDLDFGATIKGFQPGQKLFGRYTLQRILGRGGMGVVWQARDEELERDIALKFLPELVLMDREAIRDLKRETRRSLELTHPHIVRIYDFVQDPRAAAIAMELVPGDTLAARKLEHPCGHFETDELATWVRHLLEALEYAHTRAEVVHRDLKPANLMVDARGNLKIADFGIAASVSDSVSRVSAQVGSSGTPVYMSPQQMMGEKPAVTDDVYAVGATLYELLTGKPPFFSGNVLMQVQSKIPPSVATRRAELGGVAAPVSAQWESTIAACLAKETSARPQSAAEIAERLGFTGGPVRRPALETSSAAPPAAAAAPAPAAAAVVAPPPNLPVFAPVLVAAASLVTLAATGLWAMQGWYYRGVDQVGLDSVGCFAWLAAVVAFIGWSAKGRLLTRQVCMMGAGLLLLTGAFLWGAQFLILEADSALSVPLVLAAPLVAIIGGACAFYILRSAGVAHRNLPRRELSYGIAFGLLGAAAARYLPLPGILGDEEATIPMWFAIWVALLLPLWLVLMRIAWLATGGPDSRPLPSRRGLWVCAYALLHLALTFWGVQRFWQLGSVYEIGWDLMRRIVETLLVAWWVAATWTVAAAGFSGSARIRWLVHGAIFSATIVVFRELYHPVIIDYYHDLGILRSDAAVFWPVVPALIVAVSGWALLRSRSRRTVRFAVFDFVAALVAGAAGGAAGYLDLPLPSYEATIAQPLWQAIGVTFGSMILWQLFTTRAEFAAVSAAEAGDAPTSTR